MDYSTLAIPHLSSPGSRLPLRLVARERTLWPEWVSQPEPSSFTTAARGEHCLLQPAGACSQVRTTGRH